MFNVYRSDQVRLVPGQYAGMVYIVGGHLFLQINVIILYYFISWTINTLT